MSNVSSDLLLAAYLADPLSLLPAGATQDVRPDDSTSATPDGRKPRASTTAQESLAKLLRRNKVSLFPARRLCAPDMQEMLASGPLAEYLAAEERAYDHVRREYAAVRAAFAAVGIRDVLIKSAGIAPSFPHLSDNVDDLVPAGCVGAARAALLGLGYVELRNLEEPRKFFFKRFHEGEEVAAHHLHEHVGWAVSFLDEPLLLQRARLSVDDPELLIPHPEDALLITMAHALYENKSFKLGDVVKVRHCLRSGELDWERLRGLAAAKGWKDGLDVLITIFSRLDTLLYGETLFPADAVSVAAASLAGWQARYLDALFARPLEMPLAVSFVFSKRLFYAKCLADRGRSRAGKFYDVVRHTLNGAKLKLKVHSQPGMLITFSGVDGSGKTRNARALINALQRCDIRTTYVWTRAGSSRFTDLVVRWGKALLRQSPAGVSSQEQRALRRRQEHHPLVRTMWSGLVLVDLLWQYTWRVRLPLAIGRVVVCDRYTYDAVADVTAAPGEVEGLFSRLLIGLSPRPALSYLIAVPPQEASQRLQGELSTAFLEEQSRTYRALVEKYSLYVVDGGQPFGAVSDAIVRDAVVCYYRGYRTVINGLFMSNPIEGSRTTDRRG